MTNLVGRSALIALGVCALFTRTGVATAADDPRLAEIRAGFAGVQADYERVKSEIADLIRVKLSVDPQLIMLGETVTLTIEARSTAQPNAVLQVEEGCYDAQPKVSEHTLTWRKIGDSYVTRWCWKPERCGNYLLRWACNVGGDVPEFVRNVSVIDNSYAVMCLNSTSHGSPRPEPDFHELHLPFSAWTEPSTYSKRWTANSFASLSQPARQYGDDLAMFIFLSGDYVPSEAGQPQSQMRALYDETEDIQREVLADFRKIWRMHGFPKPLTSFYCYGLGQVSINLARELGYTTIGALCADQNWQDGIHKFNHWGMPARPYFVSKQDFRKTGDGGPDGMVGFQQCERQTCETRDYNCVYSFEAGIGFALDAMAGVSRARSINEISQSREKDFFQCFVECADQTDDPFFFCGGIEMNGVWPWMAGCTRQFMEYCVQRARDTRIAYATPAAVADFFRRHYTVIPESVLYLVDVYAGMAYNEKPINYNDTMEIENSTFRAIFRNRETLPYAYYDYTIPWNYPDWGNESIPRRTNGYIIPDTDARFSVTPNILDTRQFSVTSTISEESGGTRVSITVNASVAQPNLALGVWHLPRDYSRDPASYELTGAKRFVPIRASFTRNLCGVVVADVVPGQNNISVLVKTKARTPRSVDMTLRNNVKAKVLARDGTSTAYLYNVGATSDTARIALPSGVTAKLYTYESDEPVTLSGTVNITVAPGKCQRITGLSYDQLLSYCSTSARIGP